MPPQAGSGFFLIIRRPPRSTFVPYTTLFRSNDTATTEIYTLSLHEIGRARVGKECRSRWSPYHSGFGPLQGPTVAGDIRAAPPRGRPQVARRRAVASGSLQPPDCEPPLLASSP